MFVPGCLTDPEKPPQVPDAEAQSEKPVRKLGEVPATAAAPVAKSCPGATRPAADGLIDDLEDSDTRLAAFGGRSGYWWIAKADHAAVTTPAGAFASSEGGPTGSKRTVHFAGKTDSKDQWGAAVGVGFLDSGLYDASKYAGVSFKIKSSAPNLAVRVKLPDVNSHPDGGLCKTDCWNSFGKDFTVGTGWQEVVVLFSELAQQPGWGNPRPPSVTTSKLKNIEWAVNQGVDFDFFVDDIRFIECG